MSYILNTTEKITMPSKAKHSAIEELFSNFTYGEKWNVSYGEQNHITVGNYLPCELDGFEFAVNITSDGVYIGAKDYPALMRGFTTFLEEIKYDEKKGNFFLEEKCIRKNPEIGLRCAHFCLFPDIRLDYMKKCIRSCAIAKYSHIIIEFWGTLKYDCLKELGWPFAYSKSEIKELVNEANALGIEVIPMFNHLGHASQSRAIGGKHVVLDQNPRLEYMFDSYGWVWNFQKEEVYDLLSKVRDELIELCGEGSYFHLGCDEAYAYGHDIQNAEKLAEYLNKIEKELESKNRRAIIWHDMLLPSRLWKKKYCAQSDEDVSALLIHSLDKNIIIADWEYTEHEEIWESSKILKENGFNVLCCPWHKRKNIDEAVSTLTEENLQGMIYTTWHTLSTGFYFLIYAGVKMYDADKSKLEYDGHFYSANVVRKVLPSGGDYYESGWRKDWR